MWQQTLPPRKKHLGQGEYEKAIALLSECDEEHRGLAWRIANQRALNMSPVELKALRWEDEGKLRWIGDFGAFRLLTLTDTTLTVWTCDEAYQPAETLSTVPVAMTKSARVSAWSPKSGHTFLTSVDHKTINKLNIWIGVSHGRPIRRPDVDLPDLSGRPILGSQTFQKEVDFEIAGVACHEHDMFILSASGNVYRWLHEDRVEPLLLEFGKNVSYIALTSSGGGILFGDSTGRIGCVSRHATSPDRLWEIPNVGGKITSVANREQWISCIDDKGNIYVYEATRGVIAKETPILRHRDRHRIAPLSRTVFLRWLGLRRHR